MRHNARPVSVEIGGQSFPGACDAVAAALDGGRRTALMAELSSAPNFSAALEWLRDRMRCDGWVREFDRRTRAEGFHVLHDWDGKADAVTPDIIPVDVLNYVGAARGHQPVGTAALAMLLDYYYFHLLQLLSLRVWDEGDADANFDRLQGLLEALQGPEGSGQLFVSNAETLVLIATSHFELSEAGYGTLLSRVRALNRPHRARIALGHASSMGSHLRFGFEATYARDTMVMRRDNVADYPWLCFALVTLMREYHAGDSPLDRAAIVEALLNGLSPDARAFLGEAPDSLRDCEADRAEFGQLFAEHRDELVVAFADCRPQDNGYSPLALFFNFSHNIVKGMVVDALLRGQPWRVTFNDLLTGRSTTASEGVLRTELARTLMQYAQANPDRIRGELTPVIVYDPRAGHAAYTVALKKLQGAPV